MACNITFASQVKEYRNETKLFRCSFIIQIFKVRTSHDFVKTLNGNPFRPLTMFQVQIIELKSITLYKNKVISLWLTISS